MYLNTFTVLLIFCVVLQPLDVLRAQVLVSQIERDDNAPPQIMHKPITTPFPHGKAIDLKARVTDASGIKEVRLFYRVKGKKEYKPLTMSRIAGSDDYVVRISGHDVWGAGFEYYIRATDNTGTSLQRGLDFSPMKISFISAQPQPTASPAPETKQKSSTWKWVLVGVGVAAVAGLAASLGSGGGGGSGGGSNSTVTINADAPE
jgi:hypothetical protein